MLNQVMLLPGRQHRQSRAGSGKLCIGMPEGHLQIVEPVGDTDGLCLSRGVRAAYAVPGCPCQPVARHEGLVSVEVHLVHAIGDGLQQRPHPLRSTVPRAWFSFRDELDQNRCIVGCLAWDSHCTEARRGAVKVNREAPEGHLCPAQTEWCRCASQR